jgi:uncharacterized damage-inducible protein DinB
MPAQTIAEFLDYFQKIRGRTLRVVRCIPPDKLDWTCRPGQFTLGDLVRHLAAVERYVFAEGVTGQPNRYPGCGKELADGFEHVVSFMDRLHGESMSIFSRLTDADLDGKSLTAEGRSITTWKLLRAMVEHEVHHRGQIYTYLGILGVTTPPLYGLTSEQLRERSQTSA